MYSEGATCLMVELFLNELLLWERTVVLEEETVEHLAEAIESVSERVEEFCT